MMVEVNASTDAKEEATGRQDTTRHEVTMMVERRNW